MKLASEREHAAFGPRALKKPGSADWCWQTLDGLKHNYERIEERFNDIENTVQELTQFEAWKIVPPSRPYGSLDALLKAELGITQHKLNSQLLILKARNQAIDAKAPNLQPGPGRPKDNSRDERVVTRIKPAVSDTAEYAIRRLRKDRPDIHKQVLAGELTAHAGMIKAGFRKKRPSKRLTPYEKILKLLPQLSKSERANLRTELKNS